MSFPQFYLHYDTKEDKTIKVDRETTTENPFVIAIALEEALTRKLLDGTLTTENLIVNQFADPPYVIDKSLFPKETDFYVIFSTETAQLQKVVVKKPNKKTLDESKQNFIKVDTRVAYSLLSNDTTFDDWQILTTERGELAISYTPIKNDDISNLFKNRIDFLSFAEIDISRAKEVNNQLLKICEMIFDYAENSLEIHCADVEDESFKDFFLAITNKNDPSYLFKILRFGRNKSFKLSFKDKNIRDLSFFSSRFHLRNTKIQSLNNVKGKIQVKINKKELIVSNTLELSEDLPEVALVLKNKYDSSIVYRTITLKDNKTLKFSNPSIQPDELDVFPLKISKNFISIFR